MSGSKFSAAGRRQRYDYIFTGAGCAALSLVMRMIKSGKFGDKKILLIDKEPKTKNDRTWCYWEQGKGFFEDIVYKKWHKLSFFGQDYSDTMAIFPYQYKMIRGIDFYNYCFDEISIQDNIDILYGNVRSVRNQQEGIVIDLEDQVLHFDSATVFNSFFSIDINRNKDSKKEISLLQHFKGWIIETPSPVFDTDTAIFMDFRVDQNRGTTFAYVLPLSEHRALVEYTLFTKDILHDEEYEQGLRSYINDLLKISEFKIIDKEFGIIPMTTKRFDFYNKRIYHLGTVGGQTKASTGYTFRFIQKQSERILDHMVNSKALFEVPLTPNRFQFYDKVLLDVLYNNRATGKEIFTTLFKKNKPPQVLKFLDNESSVSEEMRIISTLPTLPFLKAAINQV